jgi:hypothetical protein
MLSANISDTFFKMSIFTDKWNQELFNEIAKCPLGETKKENYCAKY